MMIMPPVFNLVGFQWIAHWKRAEWPYIYDYDSIPSLLDCVAREFESPWVFPRHHLHQAVAPQAVNGRSSSRIQTDKCVSDLWWEPRSWPFLFCLS